MSVTTTNSDMLARERALDTSASFAVQAPAGSGKTELLMQRFLALLSQVDKPERILALTFTRKAAGEMHSRIIGAIRKASEGCESEKPHEMKTLGLAASALRRDRELGWDLLLNPGRLKVQTIDSFSSTVARQMPLLSGLGDYSVTDEPEELYSTAAERTIALVEDEGPEGDSVRSALDHLDNSVRALSIRLVLMLGKRDQWLRHLERDATYEGMRALLEGSLKRLVEEELREIAAEFPEELEGALLRSARHAAKNILNEKSAIPALSGLERLPGPGAEDLPLWKGIQELLLTGKNEWRKPAGVNAKLGFPNGDNSSAAMKKEFQELLESLSGNGMLERALGRVGALPDPRFPEEERETLFALMRLLPVAERELNRVFAEAGKADFQAVALSALKSLGSEDEPTDLMLALDLKVQHILVDEYQDTSQTQLSLLEALTRGWTEGDGRTLFVVGDPMQSIYLFREAQVGLFLRARKEGIGPAKLIPLTLSSNFRSSERIVEWVNRTLGPAFPEAEDFFTGAVTYAPSEAAKGAVPESTVELTLLRERDDELEAEHVLSIVKKLPENESAAILCRSRTHVDSIVEALKDNGVPFRGRDIDPLSERPVIRDLMALLKALDHPFDRVAWLASLRAPWCGLTLSDLHSLCVGDAFSPVRELASDEKRLISLSEDGRQRLTRFVERTGKALSLWGRRPPSEVLRGLWISLGGPGFAGDEGAMNDAREFFKLLRSAEGPGRVSISELERKVEALYSGGGSQDAALEIMTVHKAKGLEFDNVIIPGLGKGPRNEDRGLLIWLEKDKDLLLAPAPGKGKEGSGIYEYLSGILKEKRELEEMRLLYVAATRARNSLHLIGHVKEGEDGEMTAVPKSFLSKISHAIGEGRFIERKEDGPSPGAAPMRVRKRLPLSWELPETAPAVPVDSMEKLIEQTEPEFYWAGEAIRHMGTVVHRYLCRIAREGLVEWGRGRIEREEPRLKAMLRSLGLGAREAGEAAKEGVRTLLKAVSDPRGRWILSKRDGAGTELPVTAVLEGGIAHMVIDRTFVDEDGTLWVIDYKTGSHEGGSLEEFFHNERERYRPQLERYARALRKGGEKREIKKGLYYPAHAEFMEVK
ncbi:MAG: UvrD-helicase domain-containing protein [Deltaproteobacteria bacterium]|nr:UvrD-helicase domain-containing protein [Deltaproteobacteria bacterium]MBZ0219561.1 UvrD-helicase domain-containing protein [Deltaproteobacteria bacterium]